MKVLWAKKCRSKYTNFTQSFRLEELTCTSTDSLAGLTELDLSKPLVAAWAQFQNQRILSSNAIHCDQLIREVSRHRSNDALIFLPPYVLKQAIPYVSAFADVYPMILAKDRIDARRRRGVIDYRLFVVQKTIRSVPRHIAAPS